MVAAAGAAVRAGSVIEGEAPFWQSALALAFAGTRWRSPGSETKDFRHPFL
jgi:hypothetical protein